MSLARIFTEIGTIAINTPNTLIAFKYYSEGYKPLSSDGVWIAYNSKNLVWLPSEYQPSAIMFGRVGEDDWNRR